VPGGHEPRAARDEGVGHVEVAAPHHAEDLVDPEPGQFPADRVGYSHVVLPSADA
jgi:hypothetical protein